MCSAGKRGARLVVETDAVRADPLGPDPAVRQGAVVSDVEGSEAGGEGLGDDERLVIQGDDHAVREGELAYDLAGLAVRRHESDLAGCLAAREHLVEFAEVEGDRVDVDVAARVDRDLAPPVRRDVAEIGREAMFLMMYSASLPTPGRNPEDTRSD